MFSREERISVLQQRLEAAQLTLEEVEIKIKIRRGLLGWTKFVHHHLMKLYFNYRWMRNYLRISRGCTHFAKWQLDIAVHWREEALREVIDLGWEIGQETDEGGPGRTTEDEEDNE